jgi:chromosome segregation ATPase
MEINPTTFKMNSDSTFSIQADGNEVRLVKEEDLLSLKGANEGRTRQWDTEKATYEAKVKELTDSHATTRQQLLQEQALREQLAGKYKDYDTHVSRVGELTKEVESHKTSLKKHQDDLSARIKANLISLGASEESLKDKTLDQLRNLEEASSIFVNPATRKILYDRGNHDGRGTQIEKAKDKISAGWNTLHPNK